MPEQDSASGAVPAHDATSPIDPDSPAEADFWSREGHPEGPPESAPPDMPLPPVRWRKNLVMFLITVLSVFVTGTLYVNPKLDPFGAPLELARALPSGWAFAVPLLAILLFHEFGHYFAARYHRVPASLPFFIPLPLVSPFGTAGAVIAMRGRIRSRDALVDIGASGPLAGLLIAIPVLVYGLTQSPIEIPRSPSVTEGQSLLYLLLKRVTIGPIPVDRDVMLGPMAFAGWSGLFVTALNLLPVGQLDGGHVAYALLGPPQNRVARFVHHALLAVFAYNLVRFLGPVVRTQRWEEAGQAVSNSMFWLMWFGLLHLLARVGGRNHPPTDPGELSTGRRVVAIVTLIFFVLLFMPTPWAVI